jgi:hypothetical protein
MTSIFALWLPILLSAIIVFIASSLIHMVLPWHKSDYPKIPNEDKVRDVLRPFDLRPGDYMIPRVSGTKEMNTPEFKDKLNKGPVIIMTVLPNGQTGMASNLIQWFLFSIVIGILAAYVAGRALPQDAEYLQIFRFTGVTSFIAYSLALWEMSIWYNRSWSLTIKSTFDGLIYSLLTAGVFGWLWPR